MSRAWGLVLALVVGCAPEAPRFSTPLSVVRDPWGGLGGGFEATGFFRTEQRGGRWWLVSPAGGAFLSFGVTSVTPEGTFEPATSSYPYHQAVLARYGSDEQWASATLERLHAWGLTTLGAWSREALFDGRFPFTVNASLAMANWQTGAMPDVYSPDWVAAVQQRAHERLATFHDDPWLVGVFLDNELRWGRDWRVPRDEVIRDLFRLPSGAPGHAAVLAFLQRTYGTIEAFDAAWGAPYGSWAELDADHELPRSASEPLDVQRRFLAEYAERFFSVTVEAVRHELPHHLVLGCRFVSVLTPPEALAAAQAHVDVLSVNSYTFVDGVSAQTNSLFGPLVQADEALTAFGHGQLPVLISEYGFRAADSGLPNTWPPIYPTLATQADRASAFEGVARRAFRTPALVGLHWFEWADEPATGRFDGEDNNFGLVDVHDDPWAPVVTRMAQVFPSLEAQAFATLPPR